jgi:AbrB family looped-hinge helix DNA binding protein
MKVTEKGQVTLPKKLRDKYGITPATEIEFIERDGMIVIVKKAAMSVLSRYRGIAGKKKGLPRRTDEFLTMLRDGDDE